MLKAPSKERRACTDCNGTGEVELLNGDVGAELVACPSCPDISALTAFGEPGQIKYERDTLIWMLIDITGEPKADLFAEAIAEIKKANELKTILSQIVSSDPCRLDHHGYCQEHLWVGKSECAHGRARKLLGYDTQ